MLNSFFSIMNANNAVKALLGTPVLRIYPFGTKLGTTPTMPYALFKTVSSSPYNYLGDTPDIDLSSIQVDIYSETADNVEDCFNAIRDAIEPSGYLISYNTDNTDIENNKYHITMEIDLHDER